MVRHCPTCDRPLAKFQQCVPCRRPMAVKPALLTTRERGIRSAASRIGIEAEEYRRHLENGEKWCSYHEEWHRKDVFRRGQTDCREGMAERRRRTIRRVVCAS